MNDLLATRITPAHAGSIALLAGTEKLERDHPRACGEHITVIWDDDWDRGSPPRMRGAFNVNAPLSKSRLDHPRACGEHRIAALLLCSEMGSPPRMRGASKPSRARLLADGITPAHAGSIQPLANNDLLS